ncbi:MAG: NAD(P)H-dependent oxidoreductase [Chloroflexota bacterium]
MTKHILVLSGTPKAHSFSTALADTYADSAQQHHEVRSFHIADMVFDPDLSEGYSQDQPLEPDLQAFQQALEWADHFVITTPIWWGALPAKLKGAFDRILLPGFAFSYKKKDTLNTKLTAKLFDGASFPNKLLSGKSARIIMTMDGPAWYYRYFQGAPALRQLQISTLEFCGFKNIRHNMLGPIKHSSESQRQRWLSLMAQLGTQGV